MQHYISYDSAAPREAILLVSITAFNCYCVTCFSLDDSALLCSTSFSLSEQVECYLCCFCHHCVTIALAQSLKMEINCHWTKELYKRRPKHKHFVQTVTAEFAVDLSSGSRWAEPTIICL